MPAMDADDYYNMVNEYFGTMVQRLLKFGGQVVMDNGVTIDVEPGSDVGVVPLSKGCAMFLTVIGADRTEMYPVDKISMILIRHGPITVADVLADEARVMAANKATMEKNDYYLWHKDEADKVDWLWQ